MGYGKPPRNTQFKKGSSGNPSGRPRDAKSAATILRKALSEEVIATVNGRKRKMSKYEALITRLVNKGVEGDHRAIEYLRAKVPVLKKAFEEARERGGLSDEAEAAILRALGISPREKNEPSPRKADGTGAEEKSNG